MSSLALDWRKRVVFQAELAPSQMNRFDCRLERVPARPRPVQGSAGTIHFDNGTMEVAINRQTGLIDAYRAGGTGYLKSGAARMLVVADSPDPWGMLVRGFRRVQGAFRLMSPEASARFAGLSGKVLPPVRVIEDGPVRMVVEALFRYHHSFLCVRYTLPKQGAEFEIEARVHWNEKDRMLKLSLPFAETGSRLLGQVAFGREELAAGGDEVVAQKWVMMESGDRALSVINDRTYGQDFKDGELRLTLLRSPAYAAHPILNRPLLPEDRYSPRHDQGERVFHFWIQGGRAEDRYLQIEREALSHNEKPVALSFFPSGHGQKIGQGPGLRPGAFARLSDPAALVTAIKKAEDGEALILRLFETTGQARTVTLELPFAGVKKEIHLGGFQVYTLRYDLVEKSFTEVNLVEEDIQDR